MQHLNKPALLGFLLIFLFTRCDVINPEEPIPSYIEINEYVLTHEDAIGIQDVWVDVDGDLIGVFEIPAQFPVIASGLSTVTVRPGIKVNGINETRDDYPFYEPYKIEIDLKEAEVHTINPSSTFTNWTNVVFYDDFELDNAFIKSENSDTTIVGYSEDSFKGESCGAVFIDADTTIFQIHTEAFDKPNLGSTPGMYLEISYKTDADVQVACFVQSDIDAVAPSMHYIVGLNTTNQWTKLYIDLHSILLNYSNMYNNYSIVFDNTDMNPIAGTKFLLDEVRIVQSIDA